MSDNKKSSDNNDISPIRGLFKQNEEAYNRHHQKVEEEKEQLAKKRKDRQISDEQKRKESEQAVKNKKKNNASPLGGKVKSFFGKIVEIVTQPEDGSFYGDDNDEFEDIYSDESLEESLYKNQNVSNTLKIDDGNGSAEDESLIYQSSPAGSVSDKDNQETDTVEASEYAEFNGMKAETESVEIQQDIKDKSVENSVQVQSGQVTSDRKNTEGKTEITLGAIMHAKNTGAEGTPVTYTAKTVINEVTDEDKTEETTSDGPSEQGANESAESLVSERTNELSHNDTADEAESSEQERLNELSHVTSDKNAEPAPGRVNELSHDVSIKEEVRPAKQIKNELSHNVSDGSTENNSDEKVKTSVSDIHSQDRRTSGVSNTPKEPMVYHRSDNPTFVVMAGKFTKTLRAEYENTRRHRGYSPEPAVNEARSEVKKKTDPDSAMENKSISETKESQPKKKESTEKSNVTNISDAKIRKKRKFHIRDLFSAEGDTFDEEDNIEEEKPEITDYHDKEDIKAIKNDINYNFRKRFFRTIILAVVGIASIVMSLLVQIFPSLFTEMIHNGWLLYGFLNFIFLATAVFLEKSTIFYGIVPLKSFKATSDTAVSVTAAATVIQSVVGLFLPDVFVNGTYHMYSSLAILALLFNSVGKLLIIKRTADNFHFLCSTKANHAGKIYTDTNNAPKFVSGLPAQRPIIAYAKKSQLMSNFLQLSYASDPVEDSATFFAPFATALALICGVAYGLISGDFVGGVSSFALTAFITTPMCALIALNIPIKNLCSAALHRGAMVIGYEAIKQFSDTNAVMIESDQLYPKGNIILSGIKAFNESKLNNAILAGAAITFAVGGSMSYVFETIVQDRKHMIPSVDSVSYDDDLGLSGWIGGQRVLIGNRSLMKKHNIVMPDESVESKYRKMGNEIVYISMSGELIAMFILTYKVNHEIADSLRELSENGVSIVVRTIDSNITQTHIAEKFGIFPRCIKVLSTGLGNICHEELTSVEKPSRAYVVTDGRLSALATAISGCIVIKSTVTITKIIQILSIVIGFFLVTLISFISGFAKLGGLEILLYTCFWCIALIVVSVLARKLN